MLEKGGVDIAILLKSFKQVAGIIFKVCYIPIVVNYV